MKINNLTGLLGIIIIIAVFSPGRSVRGQQEQKNYAWYDATTYQLYTEKKWDDLISTGREALSAGHKSFYIYLRIGLGWFNKGNYMQAVHYFEQARKLNSRDPVMLEYLFLSYRALNRNGEAWIVRHQFPATLASRLEINPKSKWWGCSADGGAIVSNNFTRNSFDSKPGNQFQYREHDLNGSKTYLGLNGFLTGGRQLQLEFSYQFLQTDKRKEVEYTETQLTGHQTVVMGQQVFIGNLYDEVRNRIYYPYRINQNSIWVGAGFQPAPEWRITPAIHVIRVSYPAMKVTATDTVYFAQPWDPQPVSDKRYSVTEFDTAFNNLLGALEVKHFAGNFSLALSGSLSNLNGRTQKQLGLEAGWFPKGNLDLYLFSRFEQLIDGSRQRLLFRQMAGARLHSKLWAEGEFLTGDATNFSLNRGYLVYNTGDQLRWQAGLSLISPLTQHLQLTFRYRYVRIAGNEIQYRQSNPESLTFQYDNHLFIGGITWKI
ncbi:MAG: hypothetical protein Kow00127_18770 [Bacteroidales bacterium]